MAFACPHCGAGLVPGALEGVVACPSCGTALYVELGTGIPHRIVSCRLSEAQILREATACLARDTTARVSGATTLYYIPYFVFPRRSPPGYEGRAAVSLPAPALETISILGSDTQWYDPSAAARGARLLEPTLTVAGMGGIPTELRHVPIAHVPYESGEGDGSLWIDAERGRLLSSPAGSPRPRIPVPGLPGRLLLLAATACACALLVPWPWSAPAACVVLLLVQRGLLGRGAASAPRSPTAAP